MNGKMKVQTVSRAAGPPCNIFRGPIIVGDPERWKTLCSHPPPTEILLTNVPRKEKRRKAKKTAQQTAEIQQAVSLPSMPVVASAPSATIASNPSTPSVMTNASRSTSNGVSQKPPSQVKEYKERFIHKPTYNPRQEALPIKPRVRSVVTVPEKIEVVELKASPYERKRTQPLRVDVQIKKPRLEQVREKLTMKEKVKFQDKKEKPTVPGRSAYGEPPVSPPVVEKTAAAEREKPRDEKDSSEDADIVDLLNDDLRMSDEDDSGSEYESYD